MSDRLSAEIWIGGKIPQSAISGLCAAIADEGVSLEWGDSPFHPTNADDFADALQENAEGVMVLRLCDHEARWGEFATLEAFLQQHSISYTRHSEGSGEYDPETVEFRLGYSATAHGTNASGDMVVEVSRHHATCHLPGRRCPLRLWRGH